MVFCVSGQTNLLLLHETGLGVTWPDSRRPMRAIRDPGRCAAARARGAERAATRAAAQIGVGETLMATPAFWIQVLLIYIITFSVRFAERAWRWLFHPNDTMVLALQCLVRAEGPRDVASWGRECA